jgi:alpha-glucosidase
MSFEKSLSILPHHDGSELYLSTSSPTLQERVTFKFRAGSNFPIEQAILRLYHDGEPRFFPMKRSIIKGEQWWQVKVEIRNLKTPYRFLIVNGDTYSWLNARGFQSHDVTSTNDFQLLATPAFPKWIRSAVFYQIFPDRFATTGEYQHLKPEKFISRPWDQFPKGRDKSTGVEFFGGDLDGVSQHLKYLKKLGINGIYFTPIFPAGSTHRYDASSFDEVDPLLGGDAALIRLAKKAKSAGIYLMGDLTTNHCGREHRWLQRSLKSKKAKEREFFYWDKSVKHGYEGWWGLASLPKLNYNSQKLRELMYEGKNSIVKKWLKKPYNLSGWRIDVGNMTGRYKGEDINGEVIAGVRKALQESNSQAWLVAENADHFPSDLDGFGWHGTMNYNGFMRPIWGWLNHRAEVEKAFFGVPVSIPRFTAGEMVSAMKEFSSTIPWRNFVSSMLLLDSHDTARFRNVVGRDTKRHIAGMGLLLTYPGVPSIYAGDELGVEGQWGEDGRRTIDWSRQSWDHEFLSEVSKLIKIRRQSHALAQGGLRWILIEDDLLAFERESKREKLLVVVSRSAQKCKIEGIDEVKQRLYGPELKGQIYKSDSASLGIYRLF